VHILLVSDAWAPQINGVVRTLETTVNTLHDMGHKVTPIVPSAFPTFPLPGYDEIKMSLFWPGEVARRIKKIMEVEGPIDAIHIATEGTLGWAARAFCIRNKIPYTTSFHTKLPEYVNKRIHTPISWGWAFMKLFHQPAQRVLTTTPGMSAELHEWGINHTHLWPRGVDLEWFHPSKAPCADYADLPRPIFVYVGRVAVEKNIEAFLDLDLPGSKVVVGSGPSLDDLKAKYSDVTFTGPKSGDDLASAYADADVFVFASKTDTYGLVLLEACAAGTPVAAYPVTGPIDVLKDPTAGALDEDLQTACLKALELKSEDARRYAEGFSWERATEEFLKALEVTTLTGNET